MRSTGSVTVAGQPIAFDAVAGTIVVHAKDWSDTDALDADADKSDKDKNQPKPEASMFYTAYFKQGVPSASRPITFLFNGGPGSSTVWLRMGAFGPVRVVTADGRHTAAPYSVVNNDQSLLDASDLVFIDAPGTGFSRIAGKDKEKSFYGVDQDVDAFAQFIFQFLSQYDRWSSPKYIFGESYGTMRDAGLALALQNKDIDLNGVIMLSNILNWDFVPDDPQLNPGIDMPYIVSLPTYAATAWYHQKVGNRPQLKPFLDRSRSLRDRRICDRLAQGERPARRRAATHRRAAVGLHRPDRPLPAEDQPPHRIWRVPEGAAGQAGSDHRHARHALRRRDARSPGKVASYDPQSAAISAAYLAAWNGYVRSTLHYGQGVEYKSQIPIYSKWDYKHAPPGVSDPLIMLPNVLPDLAVAMKQNPDMKVMVNGGYYDVSTPYFEGMMEMRHLPVPPALRSNIEYRYYESGHMVYAHLPSLVALHDNVADFIRRTSGAR